MWSAGPYRTLGTAFHSGRQHNFGLSYKKFVVTRTSQAELGGVRGSHGFLPSMKIAVLLSGGVDSSVALRMLHEKEHDLKAFYLKIWLEDELAYLGDCP